MEEDQPDWTQPLLARVQSPVYDSDDNALHVEPDRSAQRLADEPLDLREPENDEIPETSTAGRHLGWGSAFVLIISRVIGSGIFATPGLIFQSVGSIGLALSLWVVGAITAWFGLMVSLEYGCMLPRSGGESLLLRDTRPLY
jgi:amino acid permease